MSRAITLTTPDICINCGKPAALVTGLRRSARHITRYRECQSCGARWTTREVRAVRRERGANGGR